MGDEWVAASGVRRDGSGRACPSESLPHQYLVVLCLFLPSRHLRVPPNLALMEHDSKLTETTTRAFESLFDFLLAGCSSVEGDIGGGATRLGIAAETFEECFAHGYWTKRMTSESEF
jgi:hypothetical protein